MVGKSPHVVAPVGDAGGSLRGSIPRTPALPACGPGPCLAFWRSPWGSATGREPVPRMATAFMFFAPSTAPTPVRPAWRPKSWEMQANPTLFSPAGPMVMISWSSPSFSFRAASVLRAPVPHRSSAGRNWTSLSRITRIFGDPACPLSTKKSYPAYLRAGPKWPPMLESPYPPVAGDLHPKWVLPLAGMRWPVKGPAAATKTFSGPNGSANRGISSHNSLATKPRPPT